MSFNKKIGVGLMKIVLILALLTIVPNSFGATCASLNLLDKASLTFNLPSYGPRSVSQIVNIINNGGHAYSLSGGSFATGFNAVPSQSGTGNDPIWAYVSGGADTQAPINNQNDTINFTINGTVCTLPIIYNILTAPNRVAPLYNALGIADSALIGCSSPGAKILGCSQIAASVIGNLPGGVAKLPANNATVTLPEFNETIKNCSGTVGPVVHVYSSVDSLNADDSIMFAVTLPSANQELIDTGTCAAHAVTLTGKNISTEPIYWDHTSGIHIGDPTKFWYFCGNQICQGVVNTSTWTVAITHPYTFSGAATIYNGGTDDTSEDNWFVFITDRDHAGSTSHPQFCWAEPSYSITPYFEHCIDYTLACTTCIANGINYAMQSRGVSPSFNKRYGWIQDQTLTTGTLYSLTTGATNPVFESHFGLVPERPGGLPSSSAYNATSMVCFDPTILRLCIDAGAHSHSVQDAFRNQYWIPSTGQVTNDSYSQGLYALNLDMCQASNSQLCTLPVANGGGLSIIFWGDLGSWEVGCVSGWCFTTQLSAVTSFQINQAATSGSNIVLTLASAPGSGLQTNDPAYVGGVGPNCPNANGAWAANQITVSGPTVTLPLKTCTSTETNNGAIYKNVYPATANFRQEIVGVKYINNALTQIYRPGVTLASDFSADRINGGYYMKVGCSPSHSLKYLVCHTNDGIPESSKVILISLNLNTIGGSIISGKTVLGGKTVQ